MPGHGLDVADDLLLDEVEAHGQQRYSEQQVQRAEPYAQPGIVTLHALSRHEVAEPNGGQRDEAEVRRVGKIPVLPTLEQERAHDDVADHQQHAQPYRHRFDVVRVAAVQLVRRVRRVGVVVTAADRRPPRVLPVHREPERRHDPRAGRHHLEPLRCNTEDRKRLRITDVTQCKIDVIRPGSSLL